MGDSVLEVDDLIKDFDGKRAVDRFSFRLRRGRILGMLGPNGAGKTTSIRMLMDIISPDSGTIRILGQRVDESLKDRIGYLPEERGLYRKMKVMDTLLYFGELKGLKRTRIRQRGQDLLERFDLAGYRDKKVEELSKGMSQKLQIIITILHDPELLILDEPFSGLDPVNIEMVKDLILEKKKDGISIIFSTHLMDYAEKIVDDIVMIHNGRKILDGTLADIKKDCSHRVISIDYRGDLSFLRGNPMVSRVRDYGNRAEIEIENMDHRQEVLKQLMQGVALEAFRVSDSSLNHIFISALTENREEEVAG